MVMRNKVKELRWVPASELRKNPKNWRRHPDSQRAALHGTVDQIGFTTPLQVRELPDGSLELIDGHLRLEEFGDETLPVVVVDLTEAEAAVALATHDPLAMMAVNDTDSLLALLQETEFDSKVVSELLEAVANGERFPMPDLTQLTGSDAEDPGADIDKADELREKWGVERGQVWEIGPHRLMCGDSADGDLDILMDGGAIDFAFTSPPYNVGVEYGEESSDTTTEWEEYSGLLIPILAAIIHHLAEGRYIGWNIGTSPKTYFFQQMAMIEGMGMTYRRLLIWQKVGVPLPTWYNTTNKHVARQFTPNYTHEIVGLFSKGAPSTGGKVSFDETLQHDVFKINQTQATVDLDNTNGNRTGVQRNLDRRARKTHPAPFPVALPKAFIQHLADVGSIVFDPFLGSGTTMVAADQLGRICYGMEIEPKYVAVALERMQGMGLEPKLVE
tara:strand:- start:113 stop:1444 length:1332 start_codon:yes stop_codon:yes gene_type:complete